MKRTPQQIREIINEKVVGKITACHNDSGHFYKIEGDSRLTTSVTSRNIIDKPHLVKWAIGLAIDFLEGENRWERLKTPEREDLIRSAKLQYTDIRDEAGSIGGEAHKIIEEYEKQWIETGIQPETIFDFIPSGTRPQVFGACRSAEQAFRKYKVTPIAFELLVGLKGIGAGTLDLIVMNEKGELELWDHKTSNNVNDFYAIQTAAYCHFFEVMTKLKIKRIKILKIDKWSDKFKVYNVPNHKDAYKAFKAVSAVYDWLNNGRDKLSEDKIIVKI
jgi:hypothetical protein